MIRQPIITVLGHVDHGKTTLLDYLRGTAVAAKEAGLITQHIGATEVPINTIQKVCGNLLDRFNLKFTLPGLLFIDTPGHEAFTNLRKRGGSVADLAIIIIDINQGIQPQTKEAIEILKTFKVPFIIAANKIDVLTGWKSHSNVFIQNIEKQLPATKEHYENLFYKLLGQISELGFDSDIYTKVENYTKKVAIIPISAKTGEGVAELLAILTGLAQKYLEKNLNIEVKGTAKGTVLEVKEEKGLGTIADIILYDGVLKKEDTILVGGLNKVITTKIKALLKPLPLIEIREKQAKFKQVKEVAAATGIRISAPDLGEALAGSPFRSARTPQEIEKAKKEIKEEIEEIIIETEQTGIILKTDTLGSLEAISNMLKALKNSKEVLGPRKSKGLFTEKGIAIKRTGVGDVNKRDVMEAAAVLEKEPLKAFILGFNVEIDEDVKKLAKTSKVTVIIDKVIYKLIEKYEDALAQKEKLIELEKVAGLTWPGKFKILPGYIFRQSNPAIFGVEILAGKIKKKEQIINKENKVLGSIKTIEAEGEKKEAAKAGERVAISVEGLTIGRQAKENDELYIDQTEESFRALKARKEVLSKAEKEVLREIAELKRKTKDTWGI